MKTQFGSVIVISSFLVGMGILSACATSLTTASLPSAQASYAPGPALTSGAYNYSYGPGYVSSPSAAGFDSYLIPQSAGSGEGSQPRAMATQQPLAAAQASAPQTQANQLSLYLSYDDSASTAGIELTKLALSLGKIPSSSWARSWEFLNYEHFDPARLKPIGLFKASLGLWSYPEPTPKASPQALPTRQPEDQPKDEPSPSSDKQTTHQIYQLGIQVAAPELDRQARQNLVLTVAVDVSASMFFRSYQGPQGPSEHTRLDLIRKGLKAMYGSLKPGDVVNLVEFSFNAVPALDHFVVGADGSAYFAAVEHLGYVGGTNLEAGLQEAYRLALKSYDPHKTNRVLMLTDAETNSGETNAEVLSRYTRINQREGIYFSGIGVGEGFQESILNTLTEAGRGSYFLMATATDAERIFTDRFMALVNIAARNVRFRIDYPTGLKHTNSAAEEVSTVPNKVQPIHFSYNSSQYFLESFSAPAGLEWANEKLRLTISYQDPTTDEPHQETLEAPLKELLNQDVDNIQAAYAINLLADLLGPVQKPSTLSTARAALTSQTALVKEYQGLFDKALALKTKGDE